MGKDLYELGEIPPIGEVPAQMHAQLVRPDRYGDPEKAIQSEVIDVPELGPHDALVMVMAAGVNFNNVWAAGAIPVDVTKTQARWGEPTDFHIVGSDASGVVYAVGDEVTQRAGRRPRRGARGAVEPRRPMGAWRARTRGSREASVCGAMTPVGDRSRSSARCRRINACRRPTSSRGRRPLRPTLTGATAYRMLFGWPPHTVEPGDVVLVWGASGGLGSLAVQLVAQRRRARGGRREQRRRRARTRPSSARSATSTARTSHTGACRRPGTVPSGRTGSAAPRRSARRSGTCSARRHRRASSSITLARTRSRPRSSWPTAAAWS